MHPSLSPLPSHLRTHTHTRACTRTHTPPPTPTHTHTHTHTRTHSFALSEANFGSPGSALSPPFLSDDYPPASLPASFTFESPTTDTKRSLEDLMPCSMPEKCGNLGPIDEELAPQPDIDKGEEYELCDPSFPRYVPKSSSPVANGTYVDFTREQYTGRWSMYNQLP